METVQQKPSVARDWRARWEMPVLMKEMRSRMRGNRMPVLLGGTATVSVVVGLCMLLFRWWIVLGAYANNKQQAMAAVGHDLFSTLVVMQAILCALIAPALTAGSISGEGEQQCLEMLLLSRLSALNIAISKLLSALGILLLMLVCTMPVMAVSFLLGGVSLREVLLDYALILVASIYGGAVGLYYSAHIRNTARTVVVAYLVSLLWIIGPLVIVFGVRALPDSVFAGFIKGITIIYPGICLIAMLFPVLVVSAIFCTCTRRTMRWWVMLFIWLGLSIAMCIWYALKPSDFVGGVIFLIIGNPAIAIQIQILDPTLPSRLNGLERWCAKYFIELSLPVLLTLAWAYLTFTTHCLREMRKPVR